MFFVHLERHCCCQLRSFQNRNALSVDFDINTTNPARNFYLLRSSSNTHTQKIDLNPTEWNGVGCNAKQLRYNTGLEMMKREKLEFCISFEFECDFSHFPFLLLARRQKSRVIRPCQAINVKIRHVYHAVCVCAQCTLP